MIAQKHIYSELQLYTGWVAAIQRGSCGIWRAHDWVWRWRQDTSVWKWLPSKAYTVSCRHIESALQPYIEAVVLYIESTIGLGDGGKTPLSGNDCPVACVG